MKQRSTFSDLLAGALLIMFATAVSWGQPSLTDHPGVALYKAGNFKESADLLTAAVKTKEQKTNAELWNFLGLARHNLLDDKNARKAFETATELGPNNVAYRINFGYTLLLSRRIDEAQSQFEKVLKIEPGNVDVHYLLGVADLWEGKIDSALAGADRTIAMSPDAYQGYALKSDALIAQLGEKIADGDEVREEVHYLKQAVEVLETGVGRVGNDAARKRLKSDLEAKDIFYKYFTKPKSDPTSLTAPPEPGVTPLKILKKQKAQYTDRARQAGVQGTLTLAVLFGASGKVEQILPIKRLGYGLDEQAIGAAYMMEFEPQKKDGKPQSTVRLVSFSFRIY